VALLSRVPPRQIKDKCLFARCKIFCRGEREATAIPHQAMTESARLGLFAVSGSAFIFHA